MSPHTPPRHPHTEQPIIVKGRRRGGLWGAALDLIAFAHAGWREARYLWQTVKDLEREAERENGEGPERP